MMNRIEIHRAAAFVVAAVALTQFAACGTAPRIKPKPLTHWSSPEDCATGYSAAVAGLPPGQGAATALLVDSIGTVWNCTTIPEGRYDATVVVRWSNGWLETALDVPGIDVAAGQTLIAKAYQRDRGIIPASFSEVKVGSVPAHVAPVHAASESVTPAHAPMAMNSQAPASPETTNAPPVATPDQSTSPGTDTSPKGPHPIIQAAKVAGLVVLALALANLSNGESLVRLPDAIGNVLRQPGSGSNDEVYGTRYNVNRARYGRPSGPPSADCCFVWIEDGVTGEVLAGSRPTQN
jgi:hypothetical protein